MQSGHNDGTHGFVIAFTFAAWDCRFPDGLSDPASRRTETLRQQLTQHVSSV